MKCPRTTYHTREHFPMLTNARRLVVTQRNCNYSAFNGYHRTYSDWSEIKCLECGHHWRSKGMGVDALPKCDRARTYLATRTGGAMKTKMATAIWVDCPGLAEGRFQHQMRDHCWNCAPFWERYPACPHCKCKLNKVGRTKCKRCKAFVMVEPDRTRTVSKEKLAEITAAMNECDAILNAQSRTTVLTEKRRQHDRNR